jgi:hypothetical protein
VSPVRVLASPIGRRRALAVLGLGVALPTLVACTSSAADEGPDPLIPLADRARADAVLVTAAITADPALAVQLDPLRSARADHAAALQQEIDRLTGEPTPAAPAPAPAPAGPADLDAVRQAVDAAAKEATGLVGRLSTERVGLVGAVAACCTTYSAILTVRT